MRRDQVQVQGRKPSKESPRAKPSPSPRGRRRPDPTHATSRSHRDCTVQTKTKPTPRARKRLHQRKPPGGKSAPDPAPAPGTHQPTAQKSCRATWRSPVVTGPRLNRDLLSPLPGGQGEAAKGSATPSRPDQRQAAGLRLQDCVGVVASCAMPPVRCHQASGHRWFRAVNKQKENHQKPAQ